ncbi:thioredoxin domain-containing protein 11-like isoform X2 [Physella acuta]|uniref:thioredoxin domain-containing protein 11-like isoform X2 n=1 Tax=Physella acuta TaxID=109671 RepID=UPI0027DCFC10|nr:thioredoxin domain-containing protein 11-like isoform X2 [Physella acuta]
MADVVIKHGTSVIFTNLKRPNEFLRGMARHPTLCLFFITVLILVTKYGTSFKAKPVTLPPKQPQYLFPPSSFVLDSPRGSLIPLIQVLNSEDFVFVMYYAPWCYKSQSAKAEFLKAAKFFKGKVRFAAVNCWWPEGDCRKRYKFLMFPVLMAYHTKLDGYRYLGILRAEHLIKFVEELLHPLSVLHSKVELLDLLAKHETVVLGCFSLTTSDSIDSYKQFYYASMRILEKDPYQPVKFAVVTKCNWAAEFGLLQYEDIIMLRIANTSLLYPHGKNITSTNLLNWALGNKGMLMIKRLSPEGMKSLALSQEINRGPAFIMFHKENPLFNIEHGYSVLKDIVLRYRECHLDPAFRSVRSVWNSVVSSSIESYRSLKQVCEQLKQAPHSSYFSCCVSAIVERFSASGKVCNICLTSNSNKCSLPLYLSSISKFTQPFSLSCRNILVNYGFDHRLSSCCYHRNKSETSSPSEHWTRNINILDKTVVFVKNNLSGDSIHRYSNDGYVRQHLENIPRQLCDKLSMEKQQDLRDDWPEEEDAADLDQAVEELHRLGCTSNKTLHFYAIDTKNRWMFSDALGINPEVSSNRTTVVLFDKEKEEHYIMNGLFSFSNTMSFISDFENGRLQRHKQSHSFQQSNCDAPGVVCVKELDSDGFITSVREANNKDLVVLIYSHWCGFCQTLSHTFLTLAQYFSTSQHIEFARINGALNDLPWEFTFDSYPTIIFFPAKLEPYDLFLWKKKSKSDSIVFPASREKSLVNLIRFVLQHSTPDTKLHLAADVCTRTCIQRNLLQSSLLLQELRQKEKLVQDKLQCYTDPTLSEQCQAQPDNLYAKMGQEFLLTQLEETQAQIALVDKLRSFLEQQGDTISKQKLVEFFSPGSSHSGA